MLDAGSQMDTGPDAGPGLAQVQLSTDTVDLGAVVVTSQGEANFTVTNPGGEAVTVALSGPAGPDGDRFARSVNIPETDGTFRLEAGGVATVTVQVSPEDEGPLLGVLALDSCGGACPQAVLLLADGVLSGVECPQEIDLGLSNLGTASLVRCPASIQVTPLSASPWWSWNRVRMQSLK